MTDDQQNDEPGTAAGNGDRPGRRRGRVDHVADELAALRRDVAEHGGLLSEALPRLDDIAGRVAGLAGSVAALTAAADEQAREDAADREARRVAGMLDEPAAPWAWPILDRPTAQGAWDSLDRWVATVLVGQYRLELRRLPSCWPAHPGAVAELSALRASHVAAHAQRAHPAASLAWSRELPAALLRIAGPDGTIDPERCPPALHEPALEHTPDQRSRERMARQPCRPEAWRPLLEQTVAADLACRREPHP